ncbi:MAG: hypothetical protein ACE5JK_07825, partial [Candidatus Omnitrophota bacterium]
MSEMRRRGGIRRKINLMFLMIAVLIVLIGVTLGYLWSFNLLRNTIGREHKREARLLAEIINMAIHEELENVKAYISDKIWRAAIRESNLMHKTMDAEAVRIFLLGMDKKWTEAPDDSPLVKKYLDNAAAREMMDV